MSQRLAISAAQRVEVAEVPWSLPTIQLRVLYVFVVLAHDRRRVVHFNVTEHPTASWAAQQIVEAFPDDTVPLLGTRS